MNLKILSLLAGGLITTGGTVTAVVISQNKEVKADEEIISPSEDLSDNDEDDSSEGTRKSLSQSAQNQTSPTSIGDNTIVGSPSENQ